MTHILLQIALFLVAVLLCSPTYAETTRLLVVTVATNETDGFIRFKKSIKTFNLDLQVFGMNMMWKGGDVRISTGGGFKVNLLKKGLEQFKDDKNLIIFFTDSYDVVFMAGKDEILKKFQQFNSKLVFSAESTLWPDRSLKNQYPEVEEGKRYLCSGGIIGYADVFWEVIHQWDLADDDDDQLYYTKIYLNPTLRTKFNATLDHKSELVQNINFAQDELLLEEGEMYSRVKNARYSTYPTVLHGNGPSKIVLNHFANYVPDGWHSQMGCRNCNSTPIIEGTFPVVQIAIFAEELTPFFEEFLVRIASLDYPRSKIHLFFHLVEETHEPIVAKFLLRHRSDYASVYIVAPHDLLDQSSARNLAIDHCMESQCDFQLSIDSTVQITEPGILRFLIEKNVQVVAPVVKKEGKLWSNFWGAINADGFYARSDDYLDIVNEKKVGIWNVPFVSGFYLTKGSTLRYLLQKGLHPYSYDGLDADMAYCNHLRNMGVFMFATNELTSGRLMTTDNVKRNQVHADLWQIQDNPSDWEEKYLHPGFWNATLDGVEVQQPCPDVYIFPLFTPHGADAVVEVMEDYGKWSDGGNKDNRLAGGYENVPTVDIHMNQVKFEKEWLHLLATYPTKIVEKVYPGFYTKAHSIMMFVVRYKPTEQSFLRPHHDSSTWTMNVALNTHGIDYEGGGCRFLRYNCSVTNIPKGHALIHPGRLTHYHEGLQTTKGTRYIAVSFVDP